MKGDFTRNTFKPQKHYQQVLMQQGRVQLDADWNEQAAIAAYRDETTNTDVVGHCGGPAENAAFRITPVPASPGDFLLSAGRYYVDGLQCEVGREVLFTQQPDLPGLNALNAGQYLIYLDVWRRHLTTIDDGEIREAALGGPDTATRVKTVWQVRAKSTTAGDCAEAAGDLAGLTRDNLPQLKARTAVVKEDSDPCVLPASAGYRGLENQLYRVEIHDGSLDANDKPQTPTFKWSRENGSVVTAITDFTTGPAGTVLTVTGIGPDDVLGFKDGDIVELLDDSHELEGVPGKLAAIDGNPANGSIKLKPWGPHPLPTPADLDLKRHAKLRRWEGSRKVTRPAADKGYLALERGVEVRFHAHNDGYRTGDYWLIPARSATADATSGDIEWPRKLDAEGKPQNDKPLPLPPRGISHHFCGLGIVKVSDEVAVKLVSDCRCLWPALTAVPRLFYVSGDGQEVMPDLTAPAGTRFKLPRPLIVGMANGHCLERATGVRFEVVNTKTSPSAGFVVVAGGAPTQSSVDVPLDSEGLAKCDFHLDDVNYSQQVEARMLDELSQPVSMPIRFNATLSLATAVAYDPDKCAGLANQVTVQAAIDQLAGQVSLHKVSGDAQSGPAGQPLPQEIVLQVANRCGPAKGVPVQFTVRAGGGSVSPPQPVITGTQGRAACKWILGSSTATQELEAAIADKSRPTAAPVSVRFTAQVPNAEAPEPGMRIKGVLLLGAAPAVPLRLGQLVSVSDLKAGLRIDCDRKVDPATVLDRGTVVTGAASRGEPTCFVTVEVPIPLTEDQRSLWGRQGLVGYAPVVLAADVKADENQIFWVLSSAAHQGLQRALGQVKEFKLGDRILARLTLKGNFIWAHGERDEERLYLDGETFRLPTGINGNDVKLPSGDNRRGGDFEMWFWLVQDFVQ